MFSVPKSSFGRNSLEKVDLSKKLENSLFERKKREKCGSLLIVKISRVSASLPLV